MAVTIDINANPKGFESALDSMRAKATHFGAHLSGLGTQIAGAFSAERLMEKAFEKINEGAEEYKKFNDEIERGQVLLGGTAEEWQRVAFAANLAEVETAELEKAILHARDTANKANKGDADAREMFANMHVDPQQFAAKSLAEQTLMLADAFAELSKRGDPVNLFMDTLGTKNRALILLLKQGREEITKTMQSAKVVSDANHEKEMADDDKRKTRRWDMKVEAGDSGIVEAKDAADETLHKLATTGAGAINFLWKAAQQTSDFLHTISFGLIGEKSGPDNSPEAIVKRVVAGMNAKPASAASPAGPIATLFGTSTERAGMATSEREMDLRNNLALETNLDTKLKMLSEERARIMADATGEKDPRKAFALMMKGKGMEGELMSIAKQLAAPDNLQVKGARIREIGGGGPLAIFGGVEVKIAEGNNYLREIRDRVLAASGGNMAFSPGMSIPWTNMPLPGSTGVFKREPSVGGFDKER